MSSYEKGKYPADLGDDSQVVGRRSEDNRGQGRRDIERYTRGMQYQREHGTDLVGSPPPSTSGSGQQARRLEVSPPPQGGSRDLHSSTSIDDARRKPQSLTDQPGARTSTPQVGATDHALLTAGL